MADLAHATIAISPNGLVDAWSPAAEALLGYSADEIIGQPLARFYPPDELEIGRWRDELEAVDLQGVFEAERWQQRKDGSRFRAKILLSEVRNREGRRIALSRVVWDLGRLRTEQREKERNEEFFRLIVSSVKDYAIFMLKPDGTVATWNVGAELLKGYRPEEIIGQHISRFYLPEDVKAGLPGRLLERARKEGRIEHEGWRLRKDGTRFWADVVISAIRDEKGALLGFSKVTRDLTERRRATEELRLSEERFRRMVANVRDYAIFMLDPTGHVATWNEGAARINGYTEQEILGQHFSRFYPPEDVESGKTEHELEVAARDGRFEDEGWRVRKDGSRFWSNVVITAVRDGAGKLIGFTKVTRDLSDRKRLEEERVRRAQAEEAIRLRDEFLSIASHELKTPLTALLLQLEATRARASGVEPVLERVERALRSAGRLGDLVEALLDVSRLATGKFELNRQLLDLKEVAHESVDRLHETVAASGCRVTIEATSEVKGCWDRLRIEQVVVNLLSNALKYAAGTDVQIRVGEEGDRAVLVVRDHGPGIPDGDRHRIFGRFERAAPTQHYGGLGLGLYVTRQIVEAHGGTIEAHNAKDGGACFKVVLPKGRTETQCAPEER